MHAKNASPSNGSTSLVKMFTDSDFFISRWEGGFGRKGGKSSSSSAMEAVRGRGAAKSSSNMERGDSESESNRNRVAGESPSRARAELPDRGDAVVSSGSNANLQNMYKTVDLSIIHI